MIDRKKLIEKLESSFLKEDKLDSFTNREYVKETKRVFRLLREPEESGLIDNTDRAIYDIVTDILNYLEKIKFHVQL